MNSFIAIRYLFTHLRQTLVCIAGVAISVMMFLAMSSMMAGFQDKFIIETVESSGHITIHDEPRQTRTQILERAEPNDNALLDLQGDKPRDQVKKIKNPTGLLATLRRMPGIESAAPMVQGEAIGTYGTKTLNVIVLGVDPVQQMRVTTIGDKVIQGSFDRIKTTADGVVIGRGVADVLGAKLDDNIVLASSEGGRTISKVVGIFDTGVTPVDYSRVYMLLNNAQTLLNRKNVINEITIRTNDYNQADLLARRIESIAGYKTEDWKEANANFLKIFKVQQVITNVITGAILIVAAFGVLNILIMAVLERVNDIAILKSFGLNRGDVTRIYLTQGAMMGVIGSTVGVTVGKVAIELLRRMPIQMEGLVRAEGLLMSEHLIDYVTAFMAAVLVTMAAAVYPARRAARYDPVEVIRGAH
ncbi:MAG: ABC transporter permease [Tepidisphaeraceae bacterium]